MVNFTPPPAGVADRLVYDYLYQLSEYLTVALSSGGWYQGNAEATEKNNTSMVPAGSGDVYSNEYRELKALVIKNAKHVEKTVDEITATLTGSYVAISDFGTYVEQLNNEIEANPEAIIQYYSFYGALKNEAAALAETMQQMDEGQTAQYQELKEGADNQAIALSELNEKQKTFQAQTEAYIRTGIVDHEMVEGVEVPIYGMAVGQDLVTSINADGETVIEKKNFRALYTAKELSFWQGENKVAYVSQNQLYITQVVALSSVRIGRWDINDDNGLAFKWIGG